jgi:hypothetical protein
LATARLRQGARTAVIEGRSQPKASRNPDVAAAAAFSRTTRRYSAGEHLFCAISHARRAMVSQDADIKLVIIAVNEVVVRRLRAFMPILLPRGVL